MDWLRGCVVDVAGRTITGGPFGDAVTATISMLYGPRAPIEVSPGVFTGWIDPATGQRVDHHYGIDLVAPQGSALLALGYGTVTQVVSGDPSFGNAIRCEYTEADGTRWAVLYLHMRDVPAFQVGELVTPGQQLGVQGTTGASTGDHLHMEIRRNDYIVDPLSALTEARALGYEPPAPPPPPVPVVYPVPDVQWVPQGWSAEGANAWTHVYPMRARTVMPGALINLVRDGRDGEWERFHIEIEDYEPGT